jgi:polyhydroxybutyrate depolymerase
LEKAWDRDAIIVYPSGLPEWWPSRSWRDGGDASDELRDFALFDALVEEFGEQYCIDKDQIYVVWHSLGAWFTNSLACARGDIIRASGSVWGSTTINNCTWPIASLIMHNPKDRLAWFGGGQTARNQMLEQNNCWSETKEVWLSEWNCVEYINCTADAPVIWCPHSQDTAWWDGSYYPHTWPDFAWSMIWDFFEEHS